MTKLHVTGLALCFAVYSLFIGDVCAMFTLRRPKTPNAQPPQAKEHKWEFSFDDDVWRNHQQKLPELLVLGLQYIECEQEGIKTEGVFRTPKSVKPINAALERYATHVKLQAANTSNAPGSPLNAPGSPLNAAGSPLNAAGNPLNAPGSPSNIPESNHFALDTATETFGVLSAGTLLRRYFNDYQQPLFPNEMLLKIIKFGLQLNTTVRSIGINRPKPPPRAVKRKEKELIAYRKNEKEKFETSLKDLVKKIHTEFPKNIPGIRMQIEQTAGMRGFFPILTNERIRAFRHLAQTAFLVVECSYFTKINFPSLGTLWGATLFHVDDAHLRSMDLLGPDEEDNGMDTMGSPLTYLYQDMIVKAVTAELFRYFDVLFEPLTSHKKNEPVDVRPSCRYVSPPNLYANMCNDPAMMPSIMHADHGRWRVNLPVEERADFKQADERIVNEDDEAKAS